MWVFIGFEGVDCGSKVGLYCGDCLRWQLGCMRLLRCGLSFPLLLFWVAAILNIS